MGMKTSEPRNGISPVFEGTASEAEPAATKTGAAHTPPIDTIGGRRFSLYSDGTPSVFRCAASKADPAATQPRAAHTPPIDIIGGCRLILYSDGMPSVFEGAAQSSKAPVRSTAMQRQEPMFAVGAGRLKPCPDARPTTRFPCCGAHTHRLQPLRSRLRATATSDNPGHGISASRRRQIQTVLSKIFSTSLLIRSAPSTRLYTSQGSVPALLS